jgi:hypothetical protein
MCDTINDEGIVPISSSVFNLRDKMDSCRQCHKQNLQSDMFSVGLGEFECVPCYYKDDYEPE